MLMVKLNERNIFNNPITTISNKAPANHIIPNITGKTENTFNKAVNILMLMANLRYNVKEVVNLKVKKINSHNYIASGNGIKE